MALRLVLVRDPLLSLCVVFRAAMQLLRIGSREDRANDESRPLPSIGSGVVA